MRYPSSLWHRDSSSSSSTHDNENGRKTKKTRTAHEIYFRVQYQIRCEFKRVHCSLFSSEVIPRFFSLVYSHAEYDLYSKRSMSNVLVYCKRKNCGEIGFKFCGACMSACYCSVACQKVDWKVHRNSCMKNLSTSFLDIDRVSKKIKQSFDRAIALKAEGNEVEAIEILEKVLIFAEYQFGPRIPGKSHRIRSNGDQIDNWRVVTMPLCLMLIQLTSLYIDQRASVSFDKALLHGLEARELIEHRRATIEFGELDYLLLLFFQTESNLAEIQMAKLRFDKAEYHCEQSLVFARQSRGVERTACIFEALKKYSSLRRLQHRLTEAMTLCEEAYTVVSGVHGPVHPLVQDAAAELIECLILTGEYSQAESYSRITYESLMDPCNGIDPESEEVARGMQQLAHLCINMEREGHVAALDLVIEADCLIRKACNIMENLHGPASPNLAICLETFGQVLVCRDIFTEETRLIFERVLAIYTDCDGGNGHGTLQALGSLGDFYYELGNSMHSGCERNVEYQKSIGIFEKAACIGAIIYGSDEKRTSKYTEKIRDIRLAIDKGEAFTSKCNLRRSLTTDGNLLPDPPISSVRITVPD